MSAIEIPTLLFWENGNSWYGSQGSTRFFIRPESDADTGGARLSVQLWRGPLELAKSEVLASASFPVTEEGLAQTTAWLADRAQELSP